MRMSVMTLGQQLKYCRMARGLTRFDVATELDCREIEVECMEHDFTSEKYSVDMGLLHKYAMLFDAELALRPKLPQRFDDVRVSKRPPWANVRKKKGAKK